MPFTYMLRCADETLYVGSARNLNVRVEQHQMSAGSEYTKRRLPVRLVWAQEFERIDEAYEMEKRIQGWAHRKRELLISGGIEAV